MLCKLFSESKLLNVIIESNRLFVHEQKSVGKTKCLSNNLNHEKSLRFNLIVQMQKNLNYISLHVIIVINSHLMHTSLEVIGHRYCQNENQFQVNKQPYERLIITTNHVTPLHS